MLKLGKDCYLIDKHIFMKKIMILLPILLLFACQNAVVEKPSNLIEKGKMEEVLYDISLLEAIKTQNIDGGITSKKINEYIYKKYKIDSIQLMKSNKYYASDIAAYKKMYQNIKERLETENKKLGGETSVDNKTQNSETPAVY